MSKEKKSRNKKIIRDRKRGLSYRKIAKIYCVNHRRIYDVVKMYEEQGK